jgi:hypothetical protein
MAAAVLKTTDPPYEHVIACLSALWVDHPDRDKKLSVMREFWLSKEGKKLADRLERLK